MTWRHCQRIDIICGVWFYWKVRPYAIVIDKCKTSLNFINKVFFQLHLLLELCECHKSSYCENNMFCHFHVMKVWSENLLIHVSKPDKVKLWHSLHVLMYCPNEFYFEVYLQNLHNDFQHIPTINVYVWFGWSNSDVPWKILQPKFGRFF